MGNVKVKWRAIDDRRQYCVADPKQRDGRGDKASSRPMEAKGPERPITAGWMALLEQEVLQTAHAEDIGNSGLLKRNLDY
jgi:folate-dependent phosphoribosylglycinamide formyltransferase PurN